MSEPGQDLTKLGCGLVSFGCLWMLLTPFVIAVVVYLASLFS